MRPGKGRSIGGLRAEGAAISGKGASGQSATLVAQLIVNSLQLSK